MLAKLILAFGDVHDTLLTSSNSSKGDERFTIFIAIPTTSTSTPGTYTIHVVTMEIDFHISGYSSARGILCACVFLVYIITEWWIQDGWISIVIERVEVAGMRSCDQCPKLAEGEEREEKEGGGGGGGTEVFITGFPQDK